MKRMRNLLPLIMLLVLILVAFATSCDRRNPPPAAPPVIVQPDPSDQRDIIKITASPDTIYADNGITYSNISVKVQDGEHFGVVGQAVLFKCTMGNILTTVYTDSTGVATTTFWDDGVTGIATITAIVRNYATDNPDSLIAADTTDVQVTIAGVPPISSLSLELPSSLNPQPLNVMQSIAVSARAKNILNMDVPDNTLITFSATRGFFTDSEGNTIGDSIVVKTSNGRASTTYNAGPIAGSGTITARIANQVSSRAVIVSPGRPANLTLRSYVEVNGELVEADTSSVNSTNYIWMQAEIKDLYSNVVPSKPIKFKTNLGTFVNTVQEITTNSNEIGVARVRFTPGLQAGAATISAYANGDTLVDQLIFNIKSTIIHSIQFTQAGQIDLNVANTGGVESRIIKVKLYDINGNLIDTPKNVYFRIMNPPASLPAGANLNNQPPGDSVLVVSNGGEAQISVNSGTDSGILNIRASCTADGKYVKATKANIVIHAGPPHRVVPFASGFNTGTDMGGGLWRIIAGANVYDVYNNPVDYGTSVWFYLPDDLMNCQIVANAYVGNESANGDSTAGVAYTTLMYSGKYTFESLKIRAVSGGMNGAEVYGEAYIILPLNQPQLELEIIPGNLVFHGNTNTVPASATAWLNLSLFDQQGNAIHNARISMTSTRGVFEYTVGTNEDPLNCNSSATPYIVVTDWFDPWAVYDPEDPTSYTDVNDGQDGLAQGLIRFYAWEIPLGDAMTNTPGITSVTVTARLLGTAASSTSTTTLIRYPS